MHLFDLPDELLVLCCTHIDVATARSLRLTCKRFDPVASQPLFSHVRLLPTTISANKARAILQDEAKMPLVSTIMLKASLDGDQKHRPTWDVDDWADDDVDDPNLEEYGLEINGELSHAFKAMLNDLGLFRNLRRVEVDFHWEVEGPDDRLGGNPVEQEGYRDPFLRNVLAALNHAEHPASKVQSLSICNLQDLSDFDTLKSADFKAVASRLETLELAIATEECPAAPESEIEYAECHQFFGIDLPDFWLAPMQQNLVNLKLYSNSYWGYLPKCDLRALHFPRLKSLGFGNMTFTHDWQLEWILSHGETLESLSLDDCPIVHDAMVAGKTDSERYVQLQDDRSLMWDPDREERWSYPSRWHDYFHKMQNGLPRLQRFAIGHGPWGSSWGADNVSGAFKNASSLAAQLLVNRYMIFHWGTGPSGWLEPEVELEDDESPRPLTEDEAEAAYGGCWDEEDDPPKYPDCWEKDTEALEELIQVVERRRAGRQGV